jgi:bifunctional non-homologous end joining protein LigD
MLKEYGRKRDFKHTSEPKPITGEDNHLIFVVQKHAARRLHYDFRLELDGVLKSWAVPNGLSDDPKQKRLAVMVEDHPLDYSKFEGKIPAGEYGAGEVIIWDQGSYAPEEDGEPVIAVDKAQEAIRQGIEKGKLSITLTGQKLKGSWALVKMKKTKNDWLIIKHTDAYAGRNALREEESVVSGLTIEDLKEPESTTKKKSGDISKIAGVRKGDFPSSLSPMLASIAKAPFSDPDWIFEPKLDGFRTIALIRRGKVSLISRNGMDVTTQYPNVAAGLGSLADQEMVIDGEVVALDDKGRTCFQCLQNRMKHRRSLNADGSEKTFSVVYYVFDILYLGGYDLTGAPLIERKRILNDSPVNSDSVHLISYFDTDGTTLFESSLKLGLEGVMAKLKNSPYEAGRRSSNWLKIKSVLTDDFVIGGFTLGSGNRRSTLGALLLGSYDAKGKLKFVGHVGSGFDQQNLAEIRARLERLKSDRNPFSEKPPLNSPAIWVKPKLVAEVKFSERTQEGYLRIPIFLRLREDKSPDEAKSVGAISEPAVRSTKKESTRRPKQTDARKVLKQLNKTKQTDADAVLTQLKNTEQNMSVDIEGHQFSLTNLDKALWPALKNQRVLTKRDLLTYLTKVSPFLLGHLRDRPLTLTRYPNGIAGKHFYQKHINDAVPEYVQTVSLAEHGGVFRDYIVCNNLGTLLWLGQLADIDLHTWFSRIVGGPDLNDKPVNKKDTADLFAGFPDFIILDIDPYIYSGQEGKGTEPELNKDAFEKTCAAALWLKETLDNLKLKSYVKTSGRTGLHVQVPILRQFDFSAVHSAAKTLCEFVLRQHPADITLDWAVAKRSGKIFLDYNQNVRGKTLATAYSPRPSPQATVSAPLSWNEIGEIYPTDFTILTMPERMKSAGDLWSDILNNKSDLSDLLKF